MATSPHKQPIKSSTKSLKAAKPAPPRDPAEVAAMVSVEGVPQFNAVSLDKRYVPARLPTGKVIEVWGDAVMRTPEGEVHPLRAGDEIRKGDVILTSQNGIVQMEVEGSRSARLPFGSDLQGPLAQVNATDQFDAPAAGVGDLGSLSDGLRVDRVSEQVTAQAFAFAGADSDGRGLTEITPNGDLLAAGNQRPEVDVQNIEVPESGIIITVGVQPAAVTGLPGFAVFTVHLDSPAVDPVTLGLTLTAGTATLGDAAQGGDFGSSGAFQGMEISTDDGVTWLSTDRVAVPTGATQALVRVPLHNDTLDEFNETFTLTAQSLPGSTQNVSVIANATIMDDDDPPTASFTAGTIDTSVPEGIGQATVTVTLSAPSGKPISIDWATADGTAIAGQDYTAATGTLVFAPGETSKTISIDITNDKRVEPNERFTVNLSNGVNVNLGAGTTTTTVANVTIVNDDNAPVLLPQTPAAGNEDTTQTGNVLTGASDADGDPITVADYAVGGTTVTAGTPTTLPGVGTIVVNPDGGYTFTPAPNYNGAVPPITFNVTDGTNVTPGTIQLTIAAVNDPPVLVHQTPPPQLEDTVQTGNVLTGATDIEGDTITVVDFTIGGVTAQAGGSLAVAGVGNFVVNSDGSYVFTPVLNYAGVVPQITFRATDGTATVGGDIQLAITPVNDAPVVAAGTASVSEEGLVAGLADTLGTSDTTNATSSSGRLAMADPEGTALTAVHLIAPTDALTSGGQTITWRGAGTLSDPLRGITDGKPVINASIDANGNYKVDLLAPIDHPNRGGEDARTITFGVSVSDGQLTSTSSLTVSVEDDAPGFDPAARSATAGLVNTNLLIVLDTSGSMSTPDGIGGLTRLDSAVQSISTLLDKYELNGNVAVRLVTFAETATPLGAGWLTVQGAKNALATIAALGETNYDAALVAATAAFQTAGGQAGGQNVAYFFSDGNPTAPVGGEGIDAAQETAWTTFLSSQSMRAVAIGLGPEPVAANLDPIAYDGARGVNTGANLVSNFEQLDGVLAGTIVAPLTGFLPGATSQAVGGADGGYISHITIDNIDYSFAALRPLGTITTTAPAGTYTYDATTHVLQVATAKGGTFNVDMDDGSYGYAPPKGAAGPLTETIAFTVGDRDGDVLSSALTINVSGAVGGAAAGAGAADAGATSVSAAASPTSDGPTVTNHAVATTDLAPSSETIASSGSTLHASPLSDVFSWTLADAGQPGTPGLTHVVGFDGQAASRGGDVLNLHDLLQGEVAGANGAVGNLGSYLDFSVVGSGDQARTTVQVSSQGGFVDGQASSAATDQVIVLDQFDIRGALGLDGHAANQQIIEAMLQQGKLVVDGSNA